MKESHDIAGPENGAGFRPGGESSGWIAGPIFFLVCFIVVFGVVAFGAVDTWSTGVLAVLAAVIVLLWMVGGWRSGELQIGISELQLPIAALIAIGLVQLLPLRGPDLADGLLAAAPVRSLSLAPYATRLAIEQLVIYLVFISAALLTINSRQRLVRVVAVITITGTAMAFFGILQRLASADSIYYYRPSPQAIPFGSFVNQHHFAALMEMTIAIPLAMLFGRSAKRDTRLLLVVAVVIMGMAVLFTSSRGGLIGLLGVLGFIVAANASNRPAAGDSDAEGKISRIVRNIGMIGGALGLLLLVAGFVLLLGGDQALLRGTGLAVSGQDLSSGRLHFWKVALDIFRNHPVIGAGLDAFGTAFTRYDTWNGQFRVEQAHNDYLQILADAGILGFLAVAAFVYFLFRNSVRLIGRSASGRFRRSTVVGAMAGCFGVLLHSFFDFPLRTPANAFVFLTLAVLATVRIRHSDPS